MLELIVKKRCKTAFEFGSGSGKNLRWLQSNGLTCYGIDVSLVNVFRAQALETNCGLGDERHLPLFGNFDAAFTCSVLDHIEDIVDIVKELKRIAPLVYLMETRDVVAEYYYDHDYTAYGFIQLPYKWKSNGDGAIYHLWRNG